MLGWAFDRSAPVCTPFLLHFAVAGWIFIGLIGFEVVNTAASISPAWSKRGEEEEGKGRGYLSSWAPWMLMIWNSIINHYYKYDALRSWSGMQLHSTGNKMIFKFILQNNCYQLLWNYIQQEKMILKIIKIHWQSDDGNGEEEDYADYHNRKKTWRFEFPDSSVINIFSACINYMQHLLTQFCSNYCTNYSCRKWENVFKKKGVR